MPDIQDSLEKFNGLEPVIILTVDGDETVKNIQKVAQKNNIETSPLSVTLIFWATDSLTLNKIPSYLEERLETLAATAQKITTDFIAEVITPLLKRLIFLSSNPAKQMTVVEEKDILRDMFLESLLAELKNNQIILDAINHQVFYVLAKDLKFRDELVKSLLANEEFLTGGTVLVSGKLVRPTISNWLKNFIEVNGSNIFDSVILSKYLSSSKSAAKLSLDEKGNISKILAIYRNLKFFPESMPNDTGAGWQILPFEILVEKNLEEAKEKIKSLPDQLEKPEKKIVPIIDQALEEKKVKLSELEKISGRYSPGSLEKKAVEEEIKKVNKK
jgi:hypothetical protein